VSLNLSSYPCYGKRNRNNKCQNCGVKLIAFCGILKEEDIIKLEAISNDKKIKKGQNIFNQGDSVSNFYNLKSGSIKIYKVSVDGRKQIIGFLFPGDFLGMSSGDEYAYSAQALEDTTLCSFLKTNLENFFIQYPIVEKKILSITNHELSAAQDQIFLLGKYSAKERILKFFLNISDQREKIGWANNPIKLSMTISDVGNYLGLTIETVSRNITLLKKEKIISEIGKKYYFLNKKNFIEELLEQ
jgi:CRP/FNR family transcriptional regulator